MSSMASWQAAHPALNTSIFRVAAIPLAPSMLALPRLKASRWQRDGRRYPFEVAPRSSVSCEKPKATGLVVPGMPTGSPGMEGGRPEKYDAAAEFEPQPPRQVIAGRAAVSAGDRDACRA